jgi:hypothetical protein
MIKAGSFHKKNSDKDRKHLAEGKFSSSRTLMIDN